MKTSVRSIVVQNPYGGSKEISIRMDNGDLKRRFLLSLLRDKAVEPSAEVNHILLEVLTELERTYRDRKVVSDALDGVMWGLAEIVVGYFAPEDCDNED